MERFLSQNSDGGSNTTRRHFLQGCASTALVSIPVLQSWGATAHSARRPWGPAERTLLLDDGWLFGGKLNAAAMQPSFDDASFSRITLPHCVAPLSWQDWKPEDWEDLWIYRRHFHVPPELRGLRLFLHFDRVMAGATPVVNGHALPQHLGGFLPFEHEITDLVRGDDNLLAVAVDARWLNVPPAGSPKGPPAVDYLLPGGISGSVTLRARPSVFIAEVFARPVDVLEPGRRLELSCRIDPGAAPLDNIALEAALHDGERVLATASGAVNGAQATLTLERLGNIALWDPGNARLYELTLTLTRNGKPLHRSRTRVGFREAKFELDGFFLNSRRTQIFGLNRHELYPYIGFSAPDRLLRRDALLLRREYNCNTVRCSHYPQSEAFLDACDELGLMVWEETPGWQYIGDESFQQLVLRDVDAMVRRDRNHPSIIVWGVRINESANDPALYARTRELAKSLDNTRQTSGTMTSGSRKTWQTEWRQDVFAFDDYHSASDGSVGIDPPLPGVPYLITECVGQFSYGGRGFHNQYRRAGDLTLQSSQAIFHAQAHSRAANNPRCAGAIAWCAFDYASLMNAYRAVKCPGIADVFRFSKLGASFYRAQVDPAVRPVIEPSFYWDFGPQSPSGPGEHAAIFSNCERLELRIGGHQHSVLHPDSAAWPHLQHAPFFADLRLDGANHPELRIDGYVAGKRVLSRSFSSNRATDRLWVHADDAELIADGSDATRLAFAAVDAFGAPRPFVEGEVRLRLEGPGIIVGDNPFHLGENGGAGAVWVRTIAARTGPILIEAVHDSLGKGSARIDVRAHSL